MDGDKRIDAMKDYYAERMTRYDQPDGQNPAGWAPDGLRELACATVAGKRLLEIASGTGLWTGWLADSAASVLGVEYTNTALAIARGKHYPPGRVQFQQGDAYALTAAVAAAVGSNGAGAPPFNAGFHADWWSHIPKAKRAAFLASFHAVLAPGAAVMMLDHCYFEHAGAFRDTAGDWIQRRKTADKQVIEVVKNFPDEAELRSDLAAVAEEIHYRHWPDCGVKGRGRWSVIYRVNK